MIRILETDRAPRPYFREEHLLFRESLRAFLEKEVVPYFDQWEEDGLVPRELWKKMGEQGFLCPWVDEKYGGLGADFGFAVILTEEMGRVGAGLSGIPLHSNVVVPYIAAYGTEEQKQKYLPGCVSGDIITAVAMTEPDAGSDLARIRTTDIRQGDVYIVNGQKNVHLQRHFVGSGRFSVQDRPARRSPSPGHQSVAGGTGYARLFTGQETEKSGNAQSRHGGTHL